MATSFNGPLKVYQRQLPTNDGSGNQLVANVGAVGANQYYTYTEASGTSGSINFARIPAGSHIKYVTAYITAGSTAVTGGTLTINFTPDNGSAVAVGTIVIPAVPANTGAVVQSVLNPTTSAGVNALANVGTVPGYLSYGAGGFTANGTFTYVTDYVIRNTDGSITNTGANLSNT
jgi:hypothetical protein